MNTRKETVYASEVIYFDDLTVLGQKKILGKSIVGTPKKMTM